MKKKITAAVLAAAIISGSGAFAYSDLENFDWASEAIYSLTEKGIINGIGNDMFDPNGGVTKEQLAKMAVLGLGTEEETSVQSFADVPRDRWSHKYVETAKYWFGAEEDESFQPEEEATRISVVRVIINALGVSTVLPKEGFTDEALIPQEDLAFAVAAQSLGIINGYPDGSFKPFGSVTRAEAAVMIERAMNTEEAPEKDPTPDATPELPPETMPEIEPTPEETPGEMPENALKARMDFFVAESALPVAENGETTVKIVGYSEGKKYSFTCEKARVLKNINGKNEEISASEIEKGDVLSVVTDITGAVKSIQLLCDVSENYSDGYAVNSYNNVKLYSIGSMDFYYGLVRRSTSGSLSLSADATEEASQTVALRDDTVYYEYFPKTKTVKVSDKGALYAEKNILETPYSEDGSFVFVRTVDNTAKEVYVINNK